MLLQHGIYVLSGLTAVDKLQLCIEERRLVTSEYMSGNDTQSDEDFQNIGWYKYTLCIGSFTVFRKSVFKKIHHIQSNFKVIMEFFFVRRCLLRFWSDTLSSVTWFPDDV